MTVQGVGDRPPAGLTCVRVVGTGLLGTSIALGLRAMGVRVLLADPSPTALALAADVGGGEPDPGAESPELVVVAAPPDVTADVVAAELSRHPQATVTDVASVKSGIAHALEKAGADTTRYVGGHPMAGRERSGPVAAQADLFIGRPWVLVPGQAGAARLALVQDVATALGAAVVRLDADEHDEAVALVSHVPQVAASLVAGRLAGASDPAVGLAGQGLRDVTRIADSDPSLWAQILSANAGHVVASLRAMRADLDDVIDALDEATPTARAAVARVVDQGRSGRQRIPGKHGGSPTRYAVVTVLIPDRPGQLARLFDDVGDAGINVEEFGLEHAAGQQVGLAEVSVLPAARPGLEQALQARGWHVVG